MTAPADDDATDPTISVVIPAFNEERVLAACLEALGRQTRPVHEIIVVDNASTDATAEIAAGFPGVRVVPETRQGVTYARNTGFDAATGDIIARIDADSIVTPDWAEQILASFQEPGVDAVAGTAGVAELSPFRWVWGKMVYRRFRGWHEHSIGITPMIYGFNGAFTREAWRSARKLVSAGDLVISDDVDVTIALMRSGGRVVYNPRLLVRAHLLRTLRPGKLGRYYETDGYTLWKHRFGNPRRWVEMPGH